MQSLRPRFVLSVACALAFIFALSAGAHDGACKSATPSEATLAASNALEASPRDLNVRITLSDALIADSCYEAAVRVLEEGEAIHGRNSHLQSRLREARSMLREQGYFEALNRAEESARLSHSLLRCNKFADIQACDAALAQRPEDPAIMIAKADALAQAKRPAEAIVAYRAARELAPEDATVEGKITAAESQRQSFLETCESGTGEPALQACQAALMRGGPDEFAILKRKGILLQSSNQSSPALDAYIAANLIEHGDRSIALAILALSDSTRRKDAVTLAARGSALLTLERASEAVAALKQALALSPGLPEAKAQLADAERLAQQEAKRKASAPTPALATPVLAAAPPARRYSNWAPVTRSN
jgi:tetratricopeptide (TPR) repeat protein